MGIGGDLCCQTGALHQGEYRRSPLQDGVIRNREEAPVDCRARNTADRTRPVPRI
jgi:hypothetical protein